MTLHAVFQLSPTKISNEHATTNSARGIWQVFGLRSEPSAFSSLSGFLLAPPSRLSLSAPFRRSVHFQWT